MAEYLHSPTDPSSLAVTRILFGMLMLFDIPDERGGAVMDNRWGDPSICHFPLLPFIQALPMPYMAAVYAALWMGALGMMLGYKGRLSAAMFSISHWYLLLVDKSFWNNHSYLFGLVGTLLAFTQAHCYWSIDAHKNPSLKSDTVPYWNYFLLKYQFFILYFMAGVKKGSVEWLSGYSVLNLSQHWVFNPFKLFLSVSQTDYLVVHWFVFLFDLTVAGWMMYRPTRNYAMIFCAIFHLMNSRLFAIGMFPWVCLAAMPLFYPFNWPKRICTSVTDAVNNFKGIIMKRPYRLTQKLPGLLDNKDKIGGNTESGRTHDNNQEDKIANIGKGANLHLQKQVKDENKQLKTNTDAADINAHTKSKQITTILIFLYVLLQAFLPFSHFITKGYNNWTNGLYGYSWDMMVHTWDIHSVVVKIVDNENQKDLFVDPFVITLNDRWTRHGDMVYQYAHCLEDHLIEESSRWNTKPSLSKNISIYIDIWYSMNGRFIQRMFDPRADMLKANWSYFSSVPYLIPLIDDALHWRDVLDDIRNDVYSWSNYSEAIFMADFPGYVMEKFISPDLVNVTLTVLEGSVVFASEVSGVNHGYSHKLNKGDRMMVDPDSFHNVLTIGNQPAFYMYTFMNATESLTRGDAKLTKQKLPIIQELNRRLRNMIKFGYLLFTYMFQMFFRLPMWLKSSI